MYILCKWFLVFIAQYTCENNMALEDVSGCESFMKITKNWTVLSQNAFTVNTSAGMFTILWVSDSGSCHWHRPFPTSCADYEQS